MQAEGLDDMPFPSRDYFNDGIAEQDEKIFLYGGGIFFLNLFPFISCSWKKIFSCDYIFHKWAQSRKVG